ncbi:group II intron maturase-specific domain-containing protein [Nonomuraea fuscirosea]|uniref:group II intron maturase-specific domain-containing protein n=1 Tax=Nonomuraea fuscirosea TaxID=1291556 RepID=UPI0033C40902
MWSTSYRHACKQILTALLSGFNQMLAGWAHSFRHGVREKTFAAIDRHAWQRIGVVRRASNVAIVPCGESRTARSGPRLGEQTGDTGTALRAERKPRQCPPLTAPCGGTGAEKRLSSRHWLGGFTDIQAGIQAQNVFES